MRIAVVAPARAIGEDAAARTLAYAALYHPGVDLVFDPQCFATAGHFAGPDALRAEAFLRYANDPAFDAIWFAAGGYGSNRILDRVMPALMPAARDKTYLGFSDTGFLLGALYARRIGRPVHGPMASSANAANDGLPVARSLAWLANRDRGVLELTLDGRPAAAFNIAILTSMIGTPWLPDLTDHILYLEEVSEAYYRIDRMLFQIAGATQLRGIAGVRLGAVSDVPDDSTEEAFGETVEQMMHRWCGEMGVPYLGRAGIGHVADNRILPFGIA